MCFHIYKLTVYKQISPLTAIFSIHNKKDPIKSFAKWLQVIHDAEADLELTKIETEKLRDKLAQMRLRLRENQTGKGMSAGHHFNNICST